MWICPIVLFCPPSYSILILTYFEHVFPSCLTMGLLALFVEAWDWARVLGERR